MIQMKKKRGFTIVELLAVIAIIAVITLIAVPIYNGVANQINIKTLESKKQNAVAAAESYSTNTGAMAVSVGILIKEGKIEPDNNAGQYLNPVNKEDLACNIITITTDKVGNSYGTFTDAKNCTTNIDELNQIYSNITIAKKDVNGNLLEGEWQNISPVYLTYEFNKDSEFLKNYVTESRWVGEEEVLGETKEVKASSIKTGTYGIYVTTVQNGVTNIHSASTEVKIDLQAPVFTKDPEVLKADEYTKGTKEVVIVANDNNGSGIYGYYYQKDLETCPTAKENYITVNDPNVVVSLPAGTFGICLMDKAGNISETKTVTIDKVDANSPIIENFTVNTTSQQGNSYYNKLAIDIHVTNEASASKVLYCISENNCDPSESVDLNGKIATVEFTESKQAPSKVCAKAVDQSGSTSEVRCSGLYYFDSTPPEDLTFTYNGTEPYKITVATNDQESGLVSYSYRLKKENGAYASKGTFATTELTNTQDFGKLSANAIYTVEVTVLNQAGLTTLKEYKFVPKITMDMASDECNPANSWCNNDVYVKYGPYRFALYNIGETSSRGVVVDANMRTALINDFCCDQGFCIVEAVFDPSHSGIYGNPRYSSEGIYTTKAFYNNLPNPTTKLNREIFTFGRASSMNNPTYLKDDEILAYYGLLDLNEYLHIYNKNFMKGKSVLLSTVLRTCLSADHYACAGETDNISAIYGYNGYIYTTSAVKGGAQNGSMVVPFKRGIIFVGGTGTYNDPYLVGDESQLKEATN